MKKLIPLFNNFQNELQNDLSFFFKETSPGFNPNIDLVENDKEYIISMDIPGLKKEDIKIDLSDSMLTISGERKNESSTNQNKVKLIEKSYGYFKRSFYLPKDIELDSIDARYENGVLNLKILKNKERVLKSIEIK